jgi:CheY-like chemotaxis protein
VPRRLIHRPDWTIYGIAEDGREFFPSGGEKTMFAEDVIILIAEDENGHALLIDRNLKRSGIENPTVRFRDGQGVLDFFFEEDSPFDPTRSYLLLLDIRMPKINGIRVLQCIKEHPELKAIPVIMVTTNDDPEEVRHCYQLGCNGFITKPIVYDRFIDAIRQLGGFLKTLQFPQVRLDTREFPNRSASHERAESRGAIGMSPQPVSGKERHDNSSSEEAFS